MTLYVRNDTDALGLYGNLSSLEHAAGGISNFSGNRALARLCLGRNRPEQVNQNRHQEERIDTLSHELILRSESLSALPGRVSFFAIRSPRCIVAANDHAEAGQLSSQARFRRTGIFIFIFLCVPDFLNLLDSPCRYGRVLR